MGSPDQPEVSRINPVCFVTYQSGCSDPAGQFPPGLDSVDNGSFVCYGAEARPRRPPQGCFIVGAASNLLA